jgi:hypothetical protein
LVITTIPKSIRRVFSEGSPLGNDINPINYLKW